LKAIVLAAGHPDSDFPIDSKPKCLYHHRGTVILEQIVRALRQGGVADVRLVVGYRARLVREFALAKGLDLDIVENDSWQTDSVRSIEVGLAGVECDALLVSGDLIIDASLIRAFRETHLEHLAWIRSVVPWGRSEGRIQYDEAYRPDIDNSIVKIPRHLFGILADARPNADRFIARYAWLSNAGRGTGVYYGAAITETFRRHPPVEEVVIQEPIEDVDYLRQTDEYRASHSARGLRSEPEPVSRPCTAETSRCEYWTWGGDYLRPECCTAHLKELLFFTEDLLSKHDIAHWLDYGCLLGAVRSQEFIPWDSDVDFGVYKRDLARIRALEPEIVAAGHWLDTRDPNVWRIHLSRTNTQHVDLYPWWEEKGLCKMTWPGATPERWAFPVRLLANPVKVTLYGKQFPAPSPVDELLARHRYGSDWRTPHRPAPSDGPDDAAHARSPIEETVRSFVLRRRQLQQFERDLVLLNDVLRATPLAEHYFVIGGLLVGWAREGRVLAHDSHDADFAFFREDRERFLAAVGPLVRAGFEPLYRYIDNDGEPVEYKFSRGGARFDFFEHERRGEAVRCRFFGAVDCGGGEEIQTEFVSDVPAFRLAPMSFLGRTWLKPDPHEDYLRTIYGEWEVPDPDYDYRRDDLSVVETRVWTGSYLWEPDGIDDQTPERRRS
jgi:hypothetical protein